MGPVVFTEKRGREKKRRLSMFGSLRNASDELRRDSSLC